MAGPRCGEPSDTDADAADETTGLVTEACVRLGEGVTCSCAAADDGGTAKTGVLAGILDEIEGVTGVTGVAALADDVAGCDTAAAAAAAYRMGVCTVGEGRDDGRPALSTLAIGCWLKLMFGGGFESTDCSKPCEHRGEQPS